MSRFCWYTVKGKQDEGIIFITAYQVCDDPNSGPLTAYREQYMTLHSEGVSKPNPRKGVLDALKELIETQRQEGYRSVLMMDANGDYTIPKGDQELQELIQDTGLADHFKDKFPAPV